MDAEIRKEQCNPPEMSSDNDDEEVVSSRYSLLRGYAQNWRDPIKNFYSPFVNQPAGLTGTAEISLRWKVVLGVKEVFLQLYPYA
eukprot:500262-Pyramimonas_sp.AAC.1